MADLGCRKKSRQILDRMAGGPHLPSDMKLGCPIARVFLRDVGLFVSSAPNLHLQHGPIIHSNRTGFSISIVSKTAPFATARATPPAPASPGFDEYTVTSPLACADFERCNHRIGAAKRAQASLLAGAHPCEGSPCGRS